MSHEHAQSFVEALRHTALVTGFSERLIEKDYYCSILLRDLGALFSQGLVFKGGTCLSKVHLKFFRLSEDLDFVLPMQHTASRSERRRAAEPIKGHLAEVVKRLPCFTEATPLTGQNNNKQ